MIWMLCAVMVTYPSIPMSSLVSSVQEQILSKNQVYSHKTKTFPLMKLTGSRVIEGVKTILEHEALTKETTVPLECQQSLLSTNTQSTDKHAIPTFCQALYGSELTLERCTGTLCGYSLRRHSHQKPRSSDSGYTHQAVSHFQSPLLCTRPFPSCCPPPTDNLPLAPF